MNEQNSRLKRRTFLLNVSSLVAVPIVSGCSEQRGSADIEVHNETDTERTISVTVTDSEGNTEFSETLTLPPCEVKDFYEARIFQNQTITIDVAVDGGPSGSTEMYIDSGVFFVRVFPDSIEFLKGSTSRPLEGGCDSGESE